MDPLKFLRFYDQAADGGSGGDSDFEESGANENADRDFANQFNRIANQNQDDAGERQFNQDLLNDRGDKGDGDQGDQNITLPEKEARAIASVMRDIGFKDAAAPKTMGDVMGVLSSMARAVKDGRSAKSKAGRLQQVISVLARDPGFADSFANAMNNLDGGGGGFGGGGSSRELPAGLTKFTKEQLAQFRENVLYFIRPELDKTRAELTGTISSKDTLRDFASGKPDFKFLLPRIKQIATETGIVITPRSLRMAYKEARDEAIADDDYPFDDRGRPLSDGRDNSKNRREFDYNFNDLEGDDERIDDEPEPGEFRTRPIRNSRSFMRPTGRGRTANNRRSISDFKDKPYDPNNADGFEAAAEQEFNQLIGALGRRGSRGGGRY